MHKLLICTLIAAICTSSVEAAIDFHGHPTDGGKQVSFEFGHDDHDSAGGDPDGCDHCCHMAGHLLGIVNADSKSPSYGVFVQRIRVETRPKNRATEPPTPPPNIRYL